MSSDTESNDTILVLAITGQEWMARSLESVLGPQGFRFVIGHTGEGGIQLAEQMDPDLLLVDFRLPDMDGVEVARRVSRSADDDGSLPLVMVSPAELSRERRLEALEAGAWEVHVLPIDMRELSAKIRTFSRARSQVNFERRLQHEDPRTGLYNVKGLMKRLSEMVADARRNNRPIGCVMLGPERPAEADRDRMQEVVESLVPATRIADPVGWTSELDFAILAPGTDERGSRTLAHRILQVLEDEMLGADEGGRPAVRLKAGVTAGSGNGAPTVPEDLLSRASAALRQAQTGGNGTAVRSYEAGEA